VTRHENYELLSALRRYPSIMRRICIFVFFLAQVAVAGEHPATLFSHEKNSRLWISGQANIIFQRHGAFPARYSGENSLRNVPEHATSRVLTLYTAYALRPDFEIIADAESAGGRGISDAFGLAGFTNLDVVRNPTLGASPYLARLMLHGVIALAPEHEPADRGPLSNFAQLPARRLEWRIGKLGTVDFFDLNNAGSDSHLQFTNWTIDNNGAFDYAADTRGYTIGGMFEWHEPSWTLRGGVMLMPIEANGIKLDKHIRRNRGHNLELELRQPRLGRATNIRFLLYQNRANMGDYRQSIAEAGEGVPDITATRRAGRSKLGFGVNADQQIRPNVRLFGRVGWNDGRNESFAYTEVDRTLQIGADVGEAKARGGHAGLALAVNGLSRPHRDYLAHGGLGFLLGDGALRYGREEILEIYYTLRIAPGIFVSADVQHIEHPGYNADRGPVTVPGLRLHVDF
jgi:hypothetical protein